MRRIFQHPLSLAGRLPHHDVPIITTGDVSLLLHHLLGEEVPHSHLVENTATGHISRRLHHVIGDSITGEVEREPVHQAILQVPVNGLA
jgi:hypothetical protein